jgi:ribosomal protein L30
VAEKQVTIRIEQVRSTIGHPPRQREVLRSLGLRRIGMRVERPDNPAVRGAIQAVDHLVAIEIVGGGKPESKREAATPVPSEPAVAEPRAKKTAKKAAKKTAKKAAKKTTKKAAKKTTKKTTKKAAKKTSKKTKKKTTKKASKASGGSS